MSIRDWFERVICDAEQESMYPVISNTDTSERERRQVMGAILEEADQETQRHDFFSRAVGRAGLSPLLETN